MTGARILVRILLAASLFCPCTAAVAQPKTKLQPETIKAFDSFINGIENEYKSILSGARPFLWVRKQDPDVQQRVRSGELVVVKERRNVDVPGGIIHLWGVSTFLPNTNAEAVVKLLLDYGRHKDVYPSVVDSRLLERKGDTVRGYLRLKYKKVLTAVLNTEHEARLYRLKQGRYSIRVRSTRIAEVGDPGEPSERERPVGEDSGFLWRLNTYWVIEQAEGGAFVECGSVTLTRDIPTGLGWLIRPFITSIPRDSLEELVQATRVALHK